MSELKEKIFKEIESQKIAPKPRWFFSVARALVWGSVVFSLAIGSVAVAIITFALTDADWDLYGRMHKSFFEYILFLVPYFWLAGMAGFAIVGYFAFRKTAGGYRVMPYVLVFGGLLLSIVGGEILYASGFGEDMHEFMVSKIPPYDRFVVTRRDVWSDPQDGLVSGKVALLPATTSFILEGWNGEKWLVTVNSSTKAFAGNGGLKNGDFIKLIAEKDSSSTLSALEIRPWRRPGPCVINGRCERINR